MRLSHGFALDVATVSDVGRVRENNEDAHGARWLPDGSLFVIVADGMGGHAAGEVASGLAVRVVEEVVERGQGDPRELLYDGLVEANRAILEEARASSTRGMGTTAIAVLLRGNEAHVAQVGDSRLYHLRGARILWRTTDHTRVQMLIDGGEITAEQARSHPEAGMLTRALGHARMADGQPLAPDVLADPLVLEPGDALVLCSDGLHDLLEDDEIAGAVAGLDARAAARRLVDEACARGGHDNVTVAVIVAGERATGAGRELDPPARRAAPAPPPPLATATLDPAAFGSAPAVASAAPAPPPPPGPAAGDRRRVAVMVGAAGAILLVAGLVMLAGVGALAWWMLAAAP